MKRCGYTYQWPFGLFVTHPSGKAHTHGADDGRVGWRRHYVAIGGNPTDEELHLRPALCGLVPCVGWGGDAFVEEICHRCDARALYLRIHELVYVEPIDTISDSLGDGWGGYLAYQAWCERNRADRTDDHYSCCGRGY